MLVIGVCVCFFMLVEDYLGNVRLVCLDLVGFFVLIV